MILSLNGIIAGKGGGLPLLLDTYSGAVGAYSLRKLRTAYTGNCVRVRRSSDNTSIDIGFDANGYINTTALASFLNTSLDGFVSIWYDQSGNGNNATQTTGANQPFLKKDGVFNIVNGKNSLFWEFGELKLGNILNGSTGASVFCLSKNTYTFYLYRCTPFYIAEANDPHFKDSDGKTKSGFSSTTRKEWFDSITYSNRNLLNANSTNGNWSFYVNNNSLFSTTTNIFQLRTENSMGGNYFGNIQEFILYPSIQTTNIVGINTDINSYYTIY